MARTKSYFASDFHLGAPNKEISLIRENKIIAWLDFIKEDCKNLFLLGDIFDFWYEWKNVVPKGYFRFLSKLYELKTLGINIYYFTGNHDIWAYSYLEEEIGLKIIRNAQMMEIDGKKFFIGHGDGIGSHDNKYKFLKKIFTNKIIQFCFSNFLHPNLAMAFGKLWSLSRKSYYRKPEFHYNKEWLVEFAVEKLKKEKIDFFIFGHRHLDTEYLINDNCKFINTGVWFKKCPYAVFSQAELSLKEFLD